jgi:hypothetical protein
MPKHSETVFPRGRAMGKFAIFMAAILGFVLALPSAAEADGVTFSTGDYYQSGLLNDGSQGTTYDILSMAGLSGSTSISPGSTVDLAISAVTFTDGPSCDANVPATGCDLVSIQTGTAVFSLTVDGIMQTMSVPFQACLTAGGFAISPLCTTNPTDDTIQLFPGAPLTFGVGPGEEIVVSNLELGPIVGSPNGTTADLDAAFTLVSSPEPSTLLLLAAGLLSLLFFVRKFGSVAV